MMLTLVRSSLLMLLFVAACKTTGNTRLHQDETLAVTAAKFQWSLAAKTPEGQAADDEVTLRSQPGQSARSMDRRPTD